MRIGLDVMGGDFAPKTTIEGAVLAQRVVPDTDKIVLFGDEKIIRDQLQVLGTDPAVFDIIHSPEVIGMGEQPTRAFAQKPESSISKGFRCLKKKRIDSFASAGNTGAMLVGSIYSVNTMQGVIRPATTAMIPKEDGKLGVLIDVGTNPDSKPDVMYQFGLLGSLYAQNVYNIDNPKVGLLNIGEEEDKGSLLTQSAFRLMKESSDFNFIGNVESRDLFKDKVDVVVCDGFTGNILLKNMEAMYRQIVKRGYGDDPFFARFNYENYGGTPILGINATVVIGHGISNAIAIKNMLLHSREVFYAGLTEKIHNAIDQYTQEKFFDAGME
ncbi:MAG: phosphate acyltransferase PlsX [Bacteroides sp.]|jgi:glycerol-3-phosphate acyltransferase PlsX|nr:phosphate acyltransferase PlsX [Bacteroides sp.]